MNIDETLKEREKSYGSFEGYCDIAYKLRSVLDDNSGNLSPMHYESLSMIICKIARILNGDPEYTDSWRDIVGYASLVEDEIEKNTA